MNTFATEPFDLTLPSPQYKLTVNNAPVFVYQARVSAVPINQVWPGYQRPIDQTEIASFAYWDMAAPVSLRIDCARPVKSVCIRPMAHNIIPRIEGSTIEFTLEKPMPTA